LRERNARWLTTNKDITHLSALALASPIMHEALNQVRQLTASLSATGDYALMQQATTIMNVLNEQLYGKLAGEAESRRWNSGFDGALVTEVSRLADAGGRVEQSSYCRDFYSEGSFAPKNMFKYGP